MQEGLREKEEQVREGKAKAESREAKPQGETVTTMRSRWSSHLICSLEARISFSVATASLLLAFGLVIPACAVGATPLGIESFTMHATETTEERPVIRGGSLGVEFVNKPYAFTRAGGHPWALTTTGEFTTEPAEPGAGVGTKPIPTRDPKDIVASLPPGLLGNPQALPRCPLTDLTSGRVCPADTLVGSYLLNTNVGHQLLGPIVNVKPEAGQSAEFALAQVGGGSIDTPLLTAHLVRTQNQATGQSEYTFTVASNGIPPLISLTGFELTFWGVPADPSHDRMRGLYCRKPVEVSPLECETNPTQAGNKPAGVPPVPFLTWPTDCSAGPLTATLRADSWEEPGRVEGGHYSEQYTEKTTTLPAVTGCQNLRFEPGTGIELQPDTKLADEPVGLGVNLHVPLNESPTSTATPLLRETRVTLPEGMSVSPGIVDGIKACEESGPEGINIGPPPTGKDESEEVGLSGELQLAPGHCPDASIVGEAEAITPFLPVPVKGHVYLARPGCGGAGQAACTEQDAVDGNLYKLYLEIGGKGVLDGEGIVFKVPLKTEANPATGQLTAIASGLVQAPYSEVRIRLNGGPRAPIDNPPACGAARTTADFTPWSAPGTTPEGVFVSGTADLLSSSFFNVDLAGDGLATPCPALPFNPGFSAGTVSPQAGEFSPFTMNLTRADREQYVKGIQLHTPPGLLAMLSSVPVCPEGQANDPAVYGECTASKIGTARVASGAGSHPFEIEGDVYLTGPHDGAPFGLSIVTHAVAGPFNLGLVVVRARIDIDPTDSTATITTDETGPYKVPQIIFGVPLRLKRITVNIDRPGFMFNPTNCKAQQITANNSGNQNATAHVSSPFAAGGCKSLEFKPTFKVSTSGKTSKALGASLDAKVSYPPFKAGSEANIAYVKVELPKQLPSRLTTLQKACIAAVFDANPANCPAASVIGVVRATTPLLPVPLQGPVYFVSHGGEAFPSLVAVLQGDGVRVDLTGTTFIDKHGVTSSTFKTVPDVPVSTFELYLPEGKFSALAANGNLCALTTTVTVKRRVTLHVHGRAVHKTVASKVSKPASLSMPTEFVGQNGSVLKKTTQITVTGCGKPTRKAKAGRGHAKQTSKARGRNR
jgi:hypothetical protein